MLVEDEPPDAYLLMKGFNEWETPNEVSHFMNGRQAMEHLESCTIQQLPHLIICDIFMPHMSGKELLKKVKSDPILRHIRFIIISSSAMNRDKAETWQAQAYLVKDLNKLMELNFKLLKCVETFWGVEGVHSYTDYSLLPRNQS